MFLMGLVMTLVTFGSLAVLFVFMKPAGIKESEALSGPARFPDSASRMPAANSASQTTAQDMQAAQPEPVPGANSSLSMLQKDPGVQGGVGGPTGGFGADASKAAAQGDAAGLIGGLKSENEAEKRAQAQKAKKAAQYTRDVLQLVVETVKDLQPKWYKDFLGNRNLKRIADDYDKSLDVRAFVEDLADSKDFMKMLGAKAGTSGMKGLMGSLFADERLSRDLKKIFVEQIDSQKFVAAVRKYGRKCFLPEDMLAGVPNEEGAEEPAPKTRKPVVMNKPKLKLTTGGGSGGFGRTGGQQGGQQQQMQQLQQMQQQMPPGMQQQMQQQMMKNPGNVDINQLQKQYQQGR